MRLRLRSQLQPVAMVAAATVHVAAAVGHQHPSHYTVVAAQTHRVCCRLLTSFKLSSHHSNYHTIVHVDYWTRPVTAIQSHIRC